LKQKKLTWLETLSTLQRLEGWLLFALTSGQQPQHVLLAAVLMRRDIARVAGDVLVSKMDTTTAMEILAKLVSPLLSLLRSKPIGHCLAEVCASLSLLNAQESIDCFTNIVNQIRTRVSTSGRGF
jgi:hypothetical protein